MLSCAGGIYRGVHAHALPACTCPSTFCCCLQPTRCTAVCTLCTSAAELPHAQQGGAGRTQSDVRIFILNRTRWPASAIRSTPALGDACMCMPHPPARAVCP